jgi:hypothetical protein
MTLVSQLLAKHRENNAEEVTKLVTYIQTEKKEMDARALIKHNALCADVLSCERENCFDYDPETDSYWDGIVPKTSCVNEKQRHKVCIQSNDCEISPAE